MSSIVEFVDKINEAEKRGIEQTLPSVSKDRHLKTYVVFNDKKKRNGDPPTCETVVIAYFVELSEEGKKPTSLWAYYSMLKSIILMKGKIDIAYFYELTAFLKRKSEGYQPTKSNVFDDYELQRFLFSAQDSLWLDVQVVCILGIFGAMRGSELMKLRTEDVTKEGNLFVVCVRNTKTKKDRYFTIHGQSCGIIKKLIGLRPPNTETDRLLLNYQNGICIHQVIGKQRIGKMACGIAEFLGSPDAEGYTSHSFHETQKVERNTTTSEQCVASKGYVETTDDYIDDSTLMDVVSDQYVASQGFIETADDNIDDLALLHLVEQEQSEQQQSKQSVASLQNHLGRHFTFNNCSVTFNFKN